MAAAAPRHRARGHACGRAGVRRLGVALALALGLGVAWAQPATAPQAGEHAVEKTVGKAGTLTVGSGDSATALAQKLRPETATLEQTLVALWRANPRAFANGNLNLLLQGATLQLPSEADILRLPAAQARALVLEQVENFQAFARQQGASPTAASAAAAVPGSSARPGAATPDPAWVRALAEAQALKDALERQNRETQARLAQLEKNIQTLQALQPPTATAAQQASSTAASGAQGEASSSDTPAGAAPTASAAPTAPSAAPSAAPTPPAAAAGTSAALLGALDRPTLLWGAAGAVLVLMLLWTWLHQRGRARGPAGARADADQQAHTPTTDRAHREPPERTQGQGQGPAPTAAPRIEIPPLMAGIDLNLGGPAPSQPEDKRP